MKERKSEAATNLRDKRALSRFIMISPLLDDNLDQASELQLRNRIAEESGLSERTLRRYVKAYRTSGFEGLKPVERVHYKKDTMPENYEELLEQAIILRREVPKRSVDQIILILELEGRVPSGVLKRATLQRHLYQAGFGATHMEVYRDVMKSSSRRFCMPNRMMLIQGDIKYGPSLPIGNGGRKIRTYLSSAIDDHSRMVLASKFYDNQEEEIIEDTFHNVILNYGRFDKCYFDNGSQYTAKQLKLSLARLSIRIGHAPVNSGKSKGKIEKFHQVVDKFIAEAEAMKIRTLDELNRYWQIYLEEYYQKTAHEGIREYYQSLNIEIPGEGITPLQEFNRDTRPLVFLDASVVGEAFMHHEIRKVDKSGCIRFDGRKYEAKIELAGKKVEISYDPAARDIITVSYRGIEPFKASPLRIGQYCAPDSPLPESMKKIEPETSRLLAALEKQAEKNRRYRADAISYDSYKKEVSSDV